MKHIFWSIIFIVLILPSRGILSAQEPYGNLMDNLLRVHIEQANRAYYMGLYDESWRILRESEDFKVNYSASFLNIEGKLLFKKGYYYEAQKTFEHLLAKDDLDPDSEAYLYEVYLRARDYNAIIRLFQKGLLKNSDAYFYHQLALFYTNDKDFKNFSQQAMHRFNHDVRFLLPLILYDKQPNSHIDRLLLLSSIVGEDEKTYFEDISVVSQDILLALLLRVDRTWQDVLLSALEPWLSNHINYQLIVRHHITQSNVMDEQTNLPDHWSKFTLPAKFVEPDWAFLSGNFVMKEYLLSLSDPAVVTSTLPWATDLTLDGFPEVIGNVNAKGNGNIYYFHGDSEHGYVNIAYSKFVIQNVVEESGANRVRINFSFFPQVATVEVSSRLANEGLHSSFTETKDDARMVYYLRFDVLSLSERFKSLAIGSTVIPFAVDGHDTPLITTMNLAKMSARIDEMRGDWLFRRLRVTNGEITQVWEDSQNKGYFDRFLEIQDGKILYGRRTFSLYDDYLLLEIYEDNALVALSFSPDGENFDFYEEHNDTYVLQIWDFNINNYIDVYRKIRIPQGQPREQRVWLASPVRISEITQRNFDEAKRWLREVY